jgi:hypothetical protein
MIFINIYCKESCSAVNKFQTLRADCKSACEDLFEKGFEAQICQTYVKYNKLFYHMYALL